MIFAYKEKSEPIEILLAEDNLADRRLTEKAFKKCKILNNVHSVKNGREAMEFLNKEGEYSNAPYPDLILLDIRMPEKDGLQVLKEIKNDPRLKRIPVIMLTSSEAEEDILRSYTLNANAYITKPVDYKGLLEIVNMLEEFWFTIVKLPPFENRYEGVEN